MSAVRIENEAGSRIGRVAAADALMTASVLIGCVLCALVYDIATWPEGLLAAFLLASFPLALAAALDVLSWRRLTAARDPSLLRTSAGEATSLAAVGLPLLLFGALFTVIEVGVGGVKDSDLAGWTSTAVGYLLVVAVGAQALLLALTWLLRRTP
jgi:hypothetical protein